MSSVGGVFGVVGGTFGAVGGGTVTNPPDPTDPTDPTSPTEPAPVGIIVASSPADLKEGSGTLVDGTQYDIIVSGHFSDGSNMAAQTVRFTYEA